MSRTEFVKGQSRTVSPAAAMAALSRRWDLAQQSDFDNDLEVLNYALLLEHLEAAFYNQGNRRVRLHPLDYPYMKQVEKDEEYHVKFLTNAISKAGGKPVPAPEVDFGDAFASRDSYLKLSHTFENVGAGAYLGAAGFIKNTAYLQAAAGIFGVEARHAAIVGDLLNLEPEGGVYMGAFETPKPKQDVLNAVDPYIID
ncbi:MAG: ferritin-like domain-containing protein [Nocardioidaceae bacterium]